MYNNVKFFPNTLLENEYGRDTLVIPVDFSTGGVNFYEGIAEQLKDLDIGVLGNVAFI